MVANAAHDSPANPKKARINRTEIIKWLENKNENRMSTKKVKNMTG